MPTMGTIRRVLQSTSPGLGLCLWLGTVAAQELSVPLSRAQVPVLAQRGEMWQWTPEGKPLAVIALDVHPSGVICGIEDRRNRLFVSEADGEWIRFGDQGPGELALGFPTQVRAGSGLTLFALDPDARTMEVYDLRGRWEQRLDLGRVMNEAGFTLLAPRDFCVDRAGNVYLLDGEAGRLFQFEAEGLGVTAVGDWADWSAHRPVALDVDGHGNLYLLEAQPPAVRMLDPGGQVFEWRVLNEVLPKGWVPDIMEVDLWGNLFLAMRGQAACWIGSIAAGPGLWVDTGVPGGVRDLAADEWGRVLAAGCGQGWIREIRLQYRPKDPNGDSRTR